MKIGGVEVSGPNEEILVLPRKDGEVVFTATAVQSFKDFEAMVPEPVAPGMRTKRGFSKNLKDPSYLSQKETYEKQRYSYLILKSLEPSEIEWETVDWDVPSTWVNWEKELKDAGFSEFELGRIQSIVMQANALDEAKLEAARKDFLLGVEEEQGDSSSQSTEPASTQSGEPVSD